jgi:hypothetical protein
MIPEFWLGFVAGITLGFIGALITVTAGLLWVWDGCRK